jgi:hypothetical protein
MTKTFAASHTQARHAIADAAFTAVRNKMILPSEQTEIVKAAMLDLQTTGSAYVCGETITLTSRAQDARRSAAIRNMSDAQFDRFAYGL